MNMDLLDSLGAEYKDFVEGERQAMLQKLTLEEQEKTQVMQLMRDAKGEAGITIEDTLEEANEKYVRWSGQQVEEGEAPITRTVGGVLYQWNEATKTWEEKVRPEEEPTAVVATDEQIRAIIRSKIAENKTYQQVIDDITLSETLANKDRARFIAAELFGMVSPGQTEEQWKTRREPVGELPKTPKIEIPEYGTYGATVLPETTIPIYE